MKVLILAWGADTGGQGYRLMEAFRDHSPDITVRSAASSGNFMEYPSDLSWRRAELIETYLTADLIHVRNSFGGLHRLERNRRRQPEREGPRGLLIQYHGSRFRGMPEPFLVEQRHRGALGVASTLDLVELAPDEVRWLPAPYEESFLQGFRSPQEGPLVIAHAPSARMVKHTYEFLEVMRELGRHHDIQLDLIEGRPWRECLARKGRADIVYDQLLYGYGNNAIEAFGMGIPVVSGIQGEAARERMLAEWGELPFAEAQPETLLKVLNELIESEEARRLYARRGMNHFRRFHAAPRVVERLSAIYREALG